MNRQKVWEERCIFSKSWKCLINFKKTKDLYSFKSKTKVWNLTIQQILTIHRWCIPEKWQGFIATSLILFKNLLSIYDSLMHQSDNTMNWNGKCLGAFSLLSKYYQRHDINSFAYVTCPSHDYPLCLVCIRHEQSESKVLSTKDCL